MFHNNCVIIDNGAGRIKFGLYDSKISHIDYAVQSIPNCSARIHKQMQILFGEDIDNTHNGSLLQYTRPFDRGYLNNWALEIDVWKSLFNHSNGLFLNRDLDKHNLVMTEPFLNPEPWQDDTNEVVFEVFGFNSYIRRPSSTFSAYNYISSNNVSTKSCLVVDSGFSFTHIAPFIDETPILHAIKRVNVGGKLLTNYLKELVSYRQWNMMDEFKLMDQVKEELCFISTDFSTDFKELRNHNQSYFFKKYNNILKQHFVLPDFQNIMRGYIKPLDQPFNSQQEQVLVMESERFCVPELLFHPSDIGIDTAGISEASWQSLRRLDELEIGLCSNNIVLTGGNVKFKNIQERYVNDLRPLIPDIYDLNVYSPEEPETYAWRGAYKFYSDNLKSGQLSDYMVTKTEYLEYGSNYCNEKFKSPLLS